MTDTTKLPRGGVNPPIELPGPRDRAIVNAALPNRAIIPLLQHAGKPAIRLVKPGDAVSEGMLIGRADGPHSANVHASVPGIVAAVREISQASGPSCEAIEIDLGGSFETSGKPRVPRPWAGLGRAEILERIRAAGVVGLGGASVPTHLKLARAAEGSCSLLAGNGLDCEPSLGADDALLREKPAEIVEGLRICQSLLSPARTVLAISERSEDLVEELQRVIQRVGMKAEVEVLPSRYPQGHEQLVVAALSGRPPGRDPSSTALNVATLYAVYEAVVLGKPLIDRILTVTGSTVSSPRNLKVRLGTRVGDLLDECGGNLAETAKVVLGGPMRGVSVSSLDLPVTKGTLGVVTFSAAEARPPRETACIRCGACIEACPWGLDPTRLFKLIRMGEGAQAGREGLARCTECGCCSYTCPSRIPLSEILGEGRRRMAASSRGSRHG
jgi:Na+-translocating ferredoxin:NAD+ oxidoreductase subunit C